MIPFRKSLAFRLLLIIFILLALPLLVDSFVLFRDAYRDALSNAQGYLVDVARYREVPLSRVQPIKRSLFVVMKDQLDLEKAFPEASEPELQKKLQAIEKAGEFSGVLLLKVTDDGHYVVVESSNPEQSGTDFTGFFADQDWIAESYRERGYFSLLVYDNASLQPYFLVGSFVEDSSGKPQGVIVVLRNITARLEKLLMPDTEKYPVYFGLLMPNTLVFAATDPRLQFQSFAPLDGDYAQLFLKPESQPEGLFPEHPIRISHDIGYPFLEFTWKGREQIGYIQSFKDGDFSLLAYAAKEDVFEEPLINFVDVYGVYLLIFLVGGLATILITRRMARPISELSRVMAGIAEGDIDRRYHSDRWGFEINTLGLIFNEMIDNLLQQKQQAEEERVTRERYEQELQIGRRVQRSLLPTTMPDYAGVSLAASYRPALEVGGDFYDVTTRTMQGKEQLVLTIADASGKGIQACFFSLGVRSMLRTYARAYADVGEIMAQTAKLFYRDSGDTGMFVTALLGIYDRETRQLHYSSCGHNPLIVRRESGEVEWHDHLCVSLGLVETIQPKEQTLSLSPGDSVIFYTDGVTEAHSPTNELFSEKRLETLLAELDNPSTEEIIAKILAAVEAFTAEAPQHDDITLLVFKVEES